MKLAKAREIVQLNIKEADKKMPPDCLDALKLCDQAAGRVEDMRISPCITADEILPGETEED